MERGRGHPATKREFEPKAEGWIGIGQVRIWNAFQTDERKCSSVCLDGRCECDRGQVSRVRIQIIKGFGYNILLTALVGGEVLAGLNR